jgi:1-acyl-sn-glycerol-3-phosphate acyltransferase
LYSCRRRVEWTDKVTRRFCESASRRATAGQFPGDLTDSFVSSFREPFRDESRRSALFGRSGGAQGGPHGSQRIRRAAASPAAAVIPVAAHVNGALPTVPRPDCGYALDDVAGDRGRSVARSDDEARVTGGLLTAGGRVLSGLLGVAPDPLEASVRMLGAAAGDVVGALGGGGRVDPLDERDPEYIRETLPALRLLSSVYFRADVRGLSNIPAGGPVLLVGNHSGGTMIADTFVFAQAFYDHFGADRRFHQLAHDLVFKVPGARALVQRYGTIPASRANMKRALLKDAALLVYPGGDHETYRPSWESSEVGFGGRSGFVELALEHNVPIVPVVAIGGQETALFLGRGRRLASALQLNRLLRLKVLPLAIGPPFGVTVLDLPGRIPLPSKITIRVLPPVDLRESLGPNPDPEEGYQLVTSTMQQTLSVLANNRRFPVIG